MYICWFSLSSSGNKVLQETFLSKIRMTQLQNEMTVYCGADLMGTGWGMDSQITGTGVIVVPYMNSNP